ncbi:hypothetical protein [Microbacterium telephonicum]|uniref:Uncharacterized protein n=1 Tax=Microbacterium telephonicum TaxID=1714841 RepID=A0A498BU02_9MICO|nr:hypothetical protein [Microbacterium telephonicum]RLK46439.1 hypothetical protein C7474_2977 [Microbacterium telephonicum]
MSDVNLNPDEAAQRARELIEADVTAKVDAVRELVAAVNEADAAEARLNDATAAHDRAWKAALAAGWSEKDLRATGARAPGQASRKPRSKRRTVVADFGSSE